MLDQIGFEKCIRENLKERRFGKKRADEIIEEFRARSDGYKKAGKGDTDAYILGMNDTFQLMSDTAIEKAKRTAKMLAIQAQNAERIKQGLAVDIKAFSKKDGPKGSRGEALARAAISLVENDPRFSGLSYATNKETTRGALWALMGDVLDNVSKGAFGRQKGKAHLPNIVREVFGDNTGDTVAKEFAAAWLKVSDTGVDMFNEVGGSMKKLQRYLPQKQAAPKLVKAGFEKWAAQRVDRWDWNRMRWPDGAPIAANERKEVMRKVFDTYVTDGANKIDDTSFRGRGRAVGNELENHRFVHYKDAASWLADHEDYGDGNVFDVLAAHIEHMAHKVALVNTFGPNPDLTVMNIEAMVRKQASGLSGKDQADAERVLKTKFAPMMDVVMRSNPLDPNSHLGALVTGTSNILTAAQLGSASLLAIPGDFMQTVAVRAFNKMDLFGGVGHYFDSILLDREFTNRIAAQSGFVSDEAVMATYSATRWTGVATVGPAVTRRISDTVMRLSLMAGHTKAARWSAQAEFMGMMHRDAGKKLEDLPYAAVMQRYGINAKEWDEMRKALPTWEPKPGVKFMRPVDIMKSELPNRAELYRKFQGMIFEEARTMVPETTIEGTVTLKDTTRPDTLVGAILHSFAMYKNFPISFYMIYGRLGMTSKSAAGRLGFYAGLGSAMTLVGAMGIQMREVAQGRDPMPMDSPKFLGKAFLAGGAMSIWGDFLFGGVNEQGNNVAEMVGGPIAGFIKDTTQLALGDVFQWADTVGSLDQGEPSKTPAKLVEYAKRYTPGSNIWWSRLALERQVWDRLAEIADPKAYKKRMAKMRKQKEKYGNEYYSEPGSRFDMRAPEYQGR